MTVVNESEQGGWLRLLDVGGVKRRRKRPIGSIHRIVLLIYILFHFEFFFFVIIFLDWHPPSLFWFQVKLLGFFLGADLIQRPLFVPFSKLGNWTHKVSKTGGVLYSKWDMFWLWIPRYCGALYFRGGNRHFHQCHEGLQCYLLSTTCTRTARTEKWQGSGCRTWTRTGPWTHGTNKKKKRQKKHSDFPIHVALLSIDRLFFCFNPPPPLVSSPSPSGSIIETCVEWRWRRRWLRSTFVDLFIDSLSIFFRLHAKPFLSLLCV